MRGPVGCGQYSTHYKRDGFWRNSKQLRTYLWEGNRTCFRLCVASQRLGVQNDGSWLWFHLQSNEKNVMHKPLLKLGSATTVSVSVLIVTVTVKLHSLWKVWSRFSGYLEVLTWYNRFIYNSYFTYYPILIELALTVLLQKQTTTCRSRPEKTPPSIFGLPL